LYCYTKEAAEFRRVAEMAAAAEEAEADDASGRATACDSTYDPTTAAPAADKSEGKQEQKINEAVGPSSSSAADAKEGDELTAVEAAAEAAAARARAAVEAAVAQAGRERAEAERLMAHARAVVERVAAADAEREAAQQLMAEAKAVVDRVAAERATTAAAAAAERLEREQSAAGGAAAAAAAGVPASVPARAPESAWAQMWRTRPQSFEDFRDASQRDFESFDALARHLVQTGPAPR
jgi:hypothetical protein